MQTDSKGILFKHDFVNHHTVLFNSTRTLFLPPPRLTINPVQSQRVNTRVKINKVEFLKVSNCGT